MYFKILILCLLGCLQTYTLFSQNKIHELNIKKLTKSQLIKVLHTNNNYKPSEWIYGDNDTTYYTKDTIVLTNDFKYFSPEKSCYQTYWVFVDVKKK